MLVGQGIFAGGVKDEDIGLADHRGNIPVMHGVNLLAKAANAGAAEADRLFGCAMNHAVNVTSATGRSHLGLARSQFTPGLQQFNAVDIRLYGLFHGRGRHLGPGLDRGRYSYSFPRAITSA